MNKNSKVLYFEGAGWDDADTSINSGVGNCRIRTRFLNNNNIPIYLEIIGTEVTKHTVKLYKGYKIVGFVDFCFTEDCNENSDFRKLEHEHFEYNKESILKFVNEKLNCSFESIEVLNDLTGYNVHNDNRTYNLMENYNYDAKLIEKRKEIKKHFYNLEKSEGKQYPNFSLWVDDKDINLLHLLRHFNGYNKHWSIRTDTANWKDTMQETKLNKYGC